MSTNRPLHGHELRRIACEASVHPTTLARALRGCRVAPLPLSRILAALQRQGLAHLLPHSDGNAHNQP